MRELKIITVPFDPRLRIFDEEALVSYLKGREVLRTEPELITHEGTALWTIYLETRRLLGAGRPEANGSARPEANGRARPEANGRARPEGHHAEAATGQLPSRRDDEDRQVAERAAFRRLLGELDEIERARYDALLDWRRRTAGDEGVPPYVILTNRQCLDVARTAPRTLEGLRQIKGVGKKRLEPGETWRQLRQRR
jgi:superfamily II DNA helicase RecQ